MRSLTIGFCGGDIGGVRALLPVIHACIARGHQVRVLDHGALATEFTGNTVSCVDAEALLQNADALLFSSSVADGRPLSVARCAAQSSIPTLHVLDHWSSYAARMRTDGGADFRPDFYLVPDCRARDEAIAHGVSADTIALSGGPAFSDVEVVQEKSFGDNELSIAFVSEPVRRDQGSDEQNPAFRGYTEIDAIAMFARFVRQSGQKLKIMMLPHPRQTLSEAMTAWDDAAAGLKAAPLTARRGRDILPLVDGLAGMASILLYEGWLAGLPVLSLQPDARFNPLANLANKEGAFFVSKDDEKTVFADWLSALQNGRHNAGESERRFHREAPVRIAELIETAVSKKAFS